MSKLLDGIMLARRLQEMTTDEIATEARKAGITGTRASGNSCLIAEWVRTESGGMVYAKVGAWHTTLLRSDKPEFAGLDINNSPAVAQFISDFDHGHYPELDKHEVIREQIKVQVAIATLDSFHKDYGNAIVAETLRLANTQEVLALTK